MPFSAKSSRQTDDVTISSGRRRPSSAPNNLRVHNSEFKAEETDREQDDTDSESGSGISDLSSAHVGFHMPDEDDERQSSLTGSNASLPSVLT